MTDTNGILLLYKPEGITSFRALGSIKKKLKDLSGTRVKVGHTGTLDRFAEGLLVVLTGKFTRLNPLFTGFDKTYEATIEFGRRTDTLDPEGEVIETAAVPDYSVIESKLPDFTGLISQRPPIFSAVHVNGERAYKKALSGSIEELPPRDVTVYSIEILEWEPPFLHCRIHCSKGTYIRSIARDLGAACGSCAHLVSLKRLTVGPFSCTDAVRADDFNPEEDLITGRGVFEAVDGFAPGLYRISELKPECLPLIKSGVIPDSSFFTVPPEADGNYALFSGRHLAACVELKNGRYSYIFVAAA